MRVSRDPDFAARIEQQLDQLHSRFAHGHAVVDALRTVNASLVPSDVATWLVREASTWIPAPCWAVVARGDMDGQPVLLAESGLTPAAGPSMWGAASWVMKSGRELFSSDLAADARVVGNVAGTVLALPLASLGRTIGVLVGVDPSPSSRAGVAVQSLSTLGGLLEPAAIALDNALTVQRTEALSVTDDLTRLFNSRYLHLVLRRRRNGPPGAAGRCRCCSSISTVSSRSTIATGISPEAGRWLKRPC